MLKFCWLSACCCLLPVLWPRTRKLYSIKTNQWIWQSVFTTTVWVLSAIPGRLCSKRAIIRLPSVGVADQIKPETAMLSGSGVTVTEQNYNYNLLTPYNILNESVGQTVKTALYNEQTGQTVFNSAKIIDSNNGRPILPVRLRYRDRFPGAHRL